MPLQFYHLPVNAIVFSSTPDGRDIEISFVDIFATLSGARGVSMPDTQGQIDWVQTFDREAPDA